MCAFNDRDCYLLEMNQTCRGFLNEERIVVLAKNKASKKGFGFSNLMVTLPNIEDSMR